MMRRSPRVLVGAALVVASLGALPVTARAQWNASPLPVRAADRPAIERLARDLESLATPLPATHQQRLTLLGAAADLRLALDDTTGALAIGAMAPPRVLVDAQRAPICAMLDRGDPDGALAFADRLTPRIRRDGVVAAIAKAMAGRRYAADSAGPSVARGRVCRK